MKFPSSLFFPVVWLIITTILFLLPGSAIPKVNWLDKIWFDKWVHTGIFILIVLIWVNSLKGRINKSVIKISLVVAVLALVYGIGIELMQHYLVMNRSFDLGDIIADAAGTGLGIVLSGRYIKK